MVFNENMSLKKFCLGHSKQEIKEIFKDKFDDKNNLLRIDGFCYKVGIDSDCVTDVFIYEPVNEETKSCSTFMNMKLTKKEEMILTGIIIDIVDNNEKPVLTEQNILKELIRRAEYFEKSQVARREIRKNNIDVAYKELE